MSIKPSRYAILMVAMALAILAGCSRKATPTDAQITIEIQSKLYSDAAIKSREINVQAANGVVTLSGQVSDDSERAAAAGDAATVEGVKTVVNNLQVQQAEAIRPGRRTVPKAPPDKPSKLYMSERHSTRTSQRPKGENDEQNSAAASAAITNDTAPSAATEPSASPADAPAKTDAAPKKVTVPAGTQLIIRLDNRLDSERNQIGDTFRGSLSDAIVLDGETVIPSGAEVAGRVSDVKSAGRFAGNSVLTLELTSLSVNGKTYNIQTNHWSRSGNGQGKSTATKVGAGTLAGAALGGIFGGGKGAAIGAGAGAGVGTGAAAAKKGQQIQLPAEAVLTFQTINAVTVIPQDSSQQNAGRTPLS